VVSQTKPASKSPPPPPPSSSSSSLSSLPSSQEQTNATLEPEYTATTPPNKLAIVPATRPPKQKPSSKKNQKEAALEAEKKKQEQKKKHGVVLGNDIDDIAKFYRLRNLCKWHLNNNRGATKRAAEFGIKQDYELEHAEAMCLLHRCVYLSHPDTIIKAIDDIPDFLDQRTTKKDLIKKYFRMMPPGSFDAWKCYKSGCADGTYVFKNVTLDEKKKYLDGTFYPPYEENIDTLNAQRDIMLRRAGIIDSGTTPPI